MNRVEGQHKGVQKTEELFGRKLTETDVSHVLSVPYRHWKVFFKAQNDEGEVGVIDLHSGEEWRFHLEISTTDKTCAFRDGWLRFVKAKNLAAGHSVVFHRIVTPESAEKLFHQFYIECIVNGKAESSSTPSSGKMNARYIQPFDDMLRSLQALEEKAHLVVREKSMNQMQLAVDQTRSRGPRFLSLSSVLCSRGVSADCVDCFLFLSLFPKDYEIDRDTLVQLWTVAGLLQRYTYTSHDVCIGYLEAFQSIGCLSCSREDQRSGKVWYKVNDFTISHELSSKFNHLRVDKTVERLSTTKPPHHVTVQHVSTNVGVLKQLSGMRTLWFLRGHESRIEHVPYDFFTSLRDLKVLGFNGTKLSELPSSIALLKDLRYLDLSETLIRKLPETIGRLRSLHTLKLQNCPNLVTLPIHTTKLTNLEHLDLGSLCYINSMPSGIGALTCLHTLSEFPIGLEYGCSLSELKDLNNLQGRVCLSRLQNVTSLLEVKKAKLIAKPRISRLELRWSPRQQNDIKFDDEVISCLEPNSNLVDLRLYYYGGSAFPSWIASPSFKNLVSITLFKCEQCKFLPSLGQLVSLESLNLNELVGVRIIDLLFCGNTIPSGDGSVKAFPKLQNLALTSMLNLEEWRDMGNFCFSSLRKLAIKDCPKLVTLCCLTNILSLQILEICYCPLLASLPTGRLPASVEKLVIEDSPLLNLSCAKLHGQDWFKVAHIPAVWIDYEEISSSDLKMCRPLS